MHRTTEGIACGPCFREHKLAPVAGFVSEAQRVEEVRAAPKPPVKPPKVKAAKVKPSKKPRAHKLAPYRAILGTVVDAEIAERAGCMRSHVTTHRNALGIPPFGRWTK